MVLKPLHRAVMRCSILMILGARLVCAQTINTSQVERLNDGVVINASGGGVLKLQVVADDIVRVAWAQDRGFFDRKSFATEVKTGTTSRWDVISGDDGVVLTTARMKAIVDSKTGMVRFEDLAGKTILAEMPGGRTLEGAEVQGEATHHVRQQWVGDSDESLYGLGQHQYGMVNIKGQDIELWQHNTEIAIPFMVSSKGYGILWDNPSYTKFGDPREYEAIPADHIFDSSGKVGGFTAAPFSDGAMTQPGIARMDAKIENSPVKGSGRTRRGDAAMRWEGQVLADVSGDYHFQLYANGGYKMWIDGELVADHWRQNWLPWDELATAHFAAGTRHAMKVEWVRDGCEYCTLKWKPAVGGENGNTSLWSQVGDGVDYYFVYGPSLDRVVAGYRELTGKAPMMPQWAFGLWQSRQRYKTQQESLDVVKGFRRRGIPFDNIVQDWMYWRENDWGSHQFDASRFPDPDQWVKDIHSLNAHLMISVWGKFYPDTDNFKIMNEKGYLYPADSSVKDWVGPGYAYTFYDAFNADARKMFWGSVRDRLFAKGMDAWWMDATEPDLLPSPPTLERQLSHMEKTAAGTGESVLNAYPLLNSKAVYEGQREAAPDQRVFILTRSAYAGSQRYASANWSGDISSTWTAMKKQIAAGLGYSISGLPYWTMDCGGFAVPSRFGGAKPSVESIDEWRELNARWFEFSTFIPLLRVHGEGPYREMWQFGGVDSDCFRAQLKFDRLRYRMLPYVYSLAGDVTQKDGTFMRPLVMDFPRDRTARDVNDEYLFGPAFLVSPVTTYKARTRAVYLPVGMWYDFWTGTAVEGGRSVEAAAPYDAMPVHVRAGSIVPFGPELQFASEKKADPLTLYVYTGADGDFTLYEDDGVSYQYEKGAFARIPLVWNERSRRLTIGARSGEFAGMLGERTFKVVFVSKQAGVGFGSEEGSRTIRYRGEAVEVSP